MNRFVRRNTMKYSRLGRNRPKLQRWRAAVGRHSKIRKNRFGYTKSPRIGFKKSSEESGKIKGKIPMVVNNIKDFNNAKKENIIIISRRVGAKKKIEMIKKANDAGLQLLNVRVSGGAHGSK